MIALIAVLVAVVLLIVAAHVYLELRLTKRLEARQVVMDKQAKEFVRITRREQEALREVLHEAMSNPRVRQLLTELDRRGG